MIIIKMERNMNTSTNKIKNTVRHFANKMGIKLTEVEVGFVPSYEYEVYGNETDETDNTYSVLVTVANPNALSNIKLFFVFNLSLKISSPICNSVYNISFLSSFS